MAVTPIQLDSIYTAIYDGLDPYAACLLAEVTDADIALLDADPSFTTHVKFYQTKREYDLLRAVNRIADGNEEHGVSAEHRWLLSKLNRKRYGNGPVEVGGSNDLPPIKFTENTDAPSAIEDID